MKGIHCAKNLKGISGATAHSFSQIRWCVLAVTWSLCANTERERERETDRERQRTPQAPLLPWLASPGIYSDSWRDFGPESQPLIASGLESQDSWWMHTLCNTTVHTANTPGSWTSDRGSEEEGKQNEEQHSLTWVQEGNSSTVETQHHFHLDLQPTAHRWKVDYEKKERTDGQTHKQWADSTPHSQSQSHYRELGSRDWRY